MAAVDEQVDLSALESQAEGIECIPCMELLRRVNEDLEQYEREIAAKRRRVVIISGIITSAVGTALTIAFVLSNWGP